MNLVRQPEWRRIYRQTIVLIEKNFIIFYRAPISTLLRALIFPIIVTLVFCELKLTSTTLSYVDTPNYGIAATIFPVKDLAAAIKAAPAQRLVFVRNGVEPQEMNPTITAILGQPGMETIDKHVVDDPNDLFTLCKQSTEGYSDCFAAVLFENLNETHLEYSIAVDSRFPGGFSSYGNFRGDDTKMSQRLLPLQWAISSQSGGFSTAPKPSVQPRGGTISHRRQADAPVENYGNEWLHVVSVFVAPVFILILIGVVYHLAIFVATERETSMAELMAAQKVSIAPRILSTFISFYALYFLGFLISSILLTQILFERTSDILLLFCTLLAGASIIASAHFLASFFGKAQLAGLYCSTLVFALALVTLAASLTNSNPQTTVTALAATFPPITWVTLIGDVATREYNLRRFSLTPSASNYKKVYGEDIKSQFMDGYLYVIFFIIQIIGYLLATYAVERGLWGVTREYSTIEAGSDVAVRCTNLSKTYNGKRRWYWPFSKRTGPVKAVDSLNLEVKRGSVTFLLGPNGGGKTTTLKCVAGMVGLDAGSQLELNEAGLVFGICPQHNVFWDTLTVNEHISIWRKLKTAAFEDLTTDDHDVIAECDLLEKTTARAKTLSGGQMRKLQLAISFVGGSRVCCIDEASSGLDPLSRRNIWDIIQKGHDRRSILVTTHFLDEADVLADHIAIVYKGKLVCEGPSTSLKARFGDSYVIRNNDAGSDDTTWKTANSTEATRKILELESGPGNKTFNVTFPTLEQVFLKVTSESSTAIRDAGGDGIVGEGVVPAIGESETTQEDEQVPKTADINLDVSHSIGFVRQVRALLQKRFVLLRQKAGWISYAAIGKFVPKIAPLQTCAANVERLRIASKDSSSYGYGKGLPDIPPFENGYPAQFSSYSPSSNPIALLGPASEFNGTLQNDLYLSTIGNYVYISSDSSGSSGLNSTNVAQEIVSRTRQFVSSTDEMIKQIANHSDSTSYAPPVAIFAPTPESSIYYYNSRESEDALMQTMVGFDYLTNRIANATTTTGTARNVVTNLRSMRHAANDVGAFQLPISVLVILGFIACTSISVIYPTFEKTNHVRALHYCNGVSPLALWVAYLLFDMQWIIIQSIIAWAILFAGPAAKVWYSSSYVFGAFVLFGIATYLGCYVLSLFLRKAAYAIAAGVHAVLFVLYLIAYVAAQTVGGRNLHEAYSAIQYGLGLSSPAANLARALFVAGNSFEVLCGKYADADTSNPFAYVRYGSVYTNLILQILFLISILFIYEHGNSDWIRRNILRCRALSEHQQFLEENSGNPAGIELRPTGSSSNRKSSDILSVSHLSKSFNKIPAVDNVSFSIAPNSTLALLGGNGAGKTTVFNMIRGVLTPDFGSITIDTINVLTSPRKARLHMGVCPQHDAIDNLTVRQTLRFYATVKGLRNIDANVDQVLKAINITTFHNYSVRALSGGTRRKLSVAIALLGDPRVLLLDEPSTGQDAGAKRILWKALKSISSNRAILLTTHSMEEAEALATGVAIMGTRMLATGTLASLQESHGGAYMIRAVRALDTNPEEVEEVVKQSFEGRVGNYLDGHGQVSFNVPHERARLGAIMAMMEELRGEPVRGKGRGVGRVFSGYVVNGPTLEEVFMNVARDAGAVRGV
ncbi:ABC transporter-like protein [Amylocarpus encephaloides]|uniref:ABC transporter-like protein n=1 Tax=Amylocarpus encephaloides TaxID=45428 RepID=A0A9P8C7P2_9HELO|nr:ABC transporter-like protein [Amylocarpus encephaloides]